VTNLIVRTFNYLVRGKKTHSTFLHYHHSALALLSAKISSLRIGIVLYMYDKIILGRHLRNLKTEKGSKSHIDALVVANGPSCNRINFAKVKESQSKGEVEILGINNSKLLADDSIANLNYLLLSDPLDEPNEKTFERLRHLESSNPSTKLLTPVGWHKSDYFQHCQIDSCLHFVDSGRNQFSIGTNPLKMRTYPPMGIFKLLAITEYLGYKNVYIIGLDLTFFRSVRLGAHSEILQDPLHFKEDYGVATDDSHLFPDGMSDYFHFISQNFFSLKKYFSDSRYINLDKDTIVDAFETIHDQSKINLWLMP